MVSGEDRFDHFTPDMQAATYSPVPAHAHDMLPRIKSREVSTEVISSETSFFSIHGFLISCIITPLMGLGYVALGFFIIFGHTTLVISHSTQRATLISQAFTALASIWHLLALIPALSVVERVRAEEWWRRLLKGTYFNRANSVSSNISGTFAHTVEIIASWSSPYFRSAWIAALVVVVLLDIAPGAIHVESGLNTVPASFPVPALPSNSIYSNYTQPFLFTGDQTHASMDIAPVYYKALLTAGTYVKAAPPALNVLVPRPDISPGQGYRYLTDVVFMDYLCDWHAPVLAEPDSMTGGIDSETLLITAGGVQGLGLPPLFGNNVNPLMGYTDPSSGNPSFDGNVAFVVTSSQPLPGFGYFDLSSVPTSAPSPSWQAAATAWWANQSLPSQPVEAISAAVCSPNYLIEPWVVDLVNGSTTLIQRQSQRVGNLDLTQLNISIQDCFKELPFTAPISTLYGTSIVQLTTLFDIPSGISLRAVPRSSKNLTLTMNFAIPTSVQAYLDGFPFGNFTPTNSKLLVPSLVLSAESNFIYATAALYAVLSGILLFLFRRPKAEQLTIESVMRATREIPIPATSLGTFRADAVAAKIEGIASAGSDADDAATEARVSSAIGGHYAVARADPATAHMVLEIDSRRDVVSDSILLERYERVRTRRSRVLWIFTPAIGATLVGFGLAVWRHPHVVSNSPQNSKATLLSALFTWALGLWRSVSLLAVGSLIRQANSDEWSRLLKRNEKHVFGPRLRGLFNEISTNTTSLIDSLRAACLTRTSIIFKVCCFAAILASLCAVVAHGTVTLLVLPSLTQQNLTIPLVVSHAIDVPWSADQNLAPLNVGLIGAAQLGASWTYLERVVGASVGDSVPQGYLVPLRTSSNNTVGSQYPTDVAHVQCECSWEAPTLPPATNESYIQVSLERLGITGIQTGPHGMASFAPISNMTFISNSTPVTTGLFAWTLWGGGPGDPVNLDSVTTTNLSTAWQEIITSQTGPAFIKAHPADAPFATNLTQVATLVCDPHIQIIPQFARAFGGIVDLASAPAGYSAGVGNMDRGYVSFMVYNYAAQQALDILGIFRPYIVFGEATGNAVLTSDPNNSAGGTVPKPTLEIAQTLDTYIGTASKSWMVLGQTDPNTTTVNGQIIQQSLIITAALPQVLVAGILYLLLGFAAYVVSARTPGAPFTLAGLLIMHSKLAGLHLIFRRDHEKDDLSSGSGND